MPASTSPSSPARATTVTTTTAARSPAATNATVLPSPTRAAATNSAGTVVSGGNVHDCLSGNDIDALISPLLGPRVVPAAHFFEVRTGKRAASSLQQALEKIVREHSFAFMPVHTRHHWATAFITARDDGCLVATICDSAPSPATARDFRRVFAELQIFSVVLQCHARQPRNSNECGVHVALLALRQAHLAASGPPSIPSVDYTVIDLKKWRECLSAALRDGVTLSVEGLAAANPAALYLSSGTSSPEGGGGTLHNVPALKKRIVTPQPTDVTNVVDVSDDVNVETDNLPLTRREMGSASAITAAELRTLDALFAEVGAEQGTAPAQTSMALRRLPQSMAKIAIALRPLAAAKLAEATASTELDCFACFEAGALVNDTVVDIVGAAITEGTPTLHVVSCARFSLFARVGRPVERPSAFDPRHEVALILHLPAASHFVLLWCSGKELRVFDSLNHEAQHPPTPEMLRLIGRFRHLLSSWGLNTKCTVRWMPCQPQGPNDCAIESVNNLLACAQRKDQSGKPLRFTRDMLKAAHCAGVRDGPKAARSSIQRDVRKIRERTTAAVTSTHNPHPTTSPIGNQLPVNAPPKTLGPVFSHNPYRPAGVATASPPALQAIKRDRPAACRRCNREHLAGGWCGWHHPAVLAATSREPCKALNSGGRPCGEWAIGVAGANSCPYHMTPEERKNVLDLLHNLPNPTQAAHVEEHARPDQFVAATPMRHANLRTLASSCAVGDYLELSSRSLPEPRVRTIVQLTHHAASGDAAVVQSARWCDTCGEWHSADAGEPTSFPLAEVLYFSAAKSCSMPTCTAECADDELGSDDEGHDAPAEPADMRGLLDTARDCLSKPAAAPPMQQLAGCTRRWFIYRGLPPHVHKITWEHFSSSTRAQHVRWLELLKHMPADMDRVALPTAAIELVMRRARERKWAWSTISSALSTLASALGHLTQYTNCQTPIDLRSDCTYRNAMQFAQRRARATALNPQRSAPLALEDFQRLAATLKGTDAWYLLHLSWTFAARPGDMRRLSPDNLRIGDAVDANNSVSASARFTAGKGFHFWGPYTIHARIPSAVAKPVREYVHHRTGCQTLCDVRAQQALSKAIGKLPDHSLRSIRRGSLMFLAACGSTDAQLKLLSGHKRTDTLMRYLGWGLHSHGAKQAADDRAHLVLQRASSPHAVNPSGGGTRPMCMGRHSGFNGKQGQRIAPPPDLFPRKAPSRMDLGLSPEGTSTSAVDTSDWTLHVKNVPCMKIDLLPSMVRSPDLREATQAAIRWLHDPALYGITWAPMKACQVPVAGFSAEHMATMLRGDFPKLRPIACDDVIFDDAQGASALEVDNPSLSPLPASTPIRCATKGFVIGQEEKRRWRPVFEPLYNSRIRKEALPPLHYPSRLERRTSVAQATFFLQFDFAAYFDQFQLSEEAQSSHVMRAREPVRVNGKLFSLFALTREPMGATHSAHVAQTCTWALCEPLLHMDGVRVSTMIDNVGIGADDEDTFVHAVRTFIERCDLARATLNDAEILPRKRVDILRAGRERPQKFLGEIFSDGRVSNTDRNVRKMREAYERLQQAAADPSIAVTKRQLASAVGLWSWTAHTLQLPLRDHHGLLRLFSALSACTTAWDDVTPISIAWLNELGLAVGPVLRNDPVAPRQPQLPSAQPQDYDAVIIVDASGTGWGALAWFDNECHEVSGGWRNAIRHSAWAEPIAALMSVRWIRARLRAPRIALVTDHIALALGQRRPLTGNGGFSQAYHLNNFFRELYEDGGDHRVFFVAGVDNPADAPSRASFIGQNVRSRPADLLFPHLATFTHPYRDAAARPWWNV